MNPVRFFGKGITYLGKGALYLMIVLGPAMIDLVILAYLLKKDNQNHRHSNNNDNRSLFLSVIIWRDIFSNNIALHRSFFDENNPYMLISPILSGIAVILSIPLGVPEVGALLLAGWIGAFTIFAAGMAIEELGEWLGSFATSPIARGQGVTTGTLPVSNPQHSSNLQPAQGTPSAPPRADQQNQRASYDPRLFNSNKTGVCGQTIYLTPSAPPESAFPPPAADVSYDLPPPYSVN